jgi:hypothetical protein
MLKLPHYLAVLALLTIPTIAPAAVADSCYMVTSSGQRINLGSVCSKQAPGSPASSPASRFNTRPSESVSQARSYGTTMVHQGRGGRVANGTAEDFHYQVWAVSRSSNYNLVVWREEEFPSGSPMEFTAFRSVGEALNYFDCRYTDKSIPTCPRN